MSVCLQSYQSSTEQLPLSPDSLEHTYRHEIDCSVLMTRFGFSDDTNDINIIKDIFYQFGYEISSISLSSSIQDWPTVEISACIDGDTSLMPELSADILSASLELATQPTQSTQPTPAKKPTRRTMIAKPNQSDSVNCIVDTIMEDF